MIRESGLETDSGRVLEGGKLRNTFIKSVAPALSYKISRVFLIMGLQMKSVRGF